MKRIENSSTIYLIGNSDKTVYRLIREGAIPIAIALIYLLLNPIILISLSHVCATTAYSDKLETLIVMALMSACFVIAALSAFITKSVVGTILCACLNIIIIRVMINAYWDDSFAGMGYGDIAVIAYFVCIVLSALLCFVSLIKIVISKTR